MCICACVYVHIGIRAHILSLNCQKALALLESEVSSVCFRHSSTRENASLVLRKSQNAVI